MYKLVLAGALQASVVRTICNRGWLQNSPACRWGTKLGLLRKPLVLRQFALESAKAICLPEMLCSGCSVNVVFA